ncbi:MAG: hypothetical protein PHF29_08325 [Candidatus Riflebacteria bacterium]|nr:hypothetical protein [Candidatus Riflebacteria bacterium]
MADQFRNEKLEALKNSLNAVKEKKQTAKPKSGLHYGRIIAFFVFLIVAYFSFVSLIDNTEKNFLNRTAQYEANFKNFAQTYIEIAKNGNAKGSSNILITDPTKTKPLICYAKPDKDGRTIARIHYNMPENRKPQKTDEANPVVVMTIKQERTYTSLGKFKTKFPIYDIYIDYIDSKKNIIFKHEVIKGDPTDEESSQNRIAPGTIPIINAQTAIAKSLIYTPSFAWHSSY